MTSSTGPGSAVRAFLRTQRRGAAFFALSATMVLSGIHAIPAAAADWPMFGQNLQNTAAAQTNGAWDVSQLKTKWTFTTGGEVSARAAVVEGIVYFPDWGPVLNAAVPSVTGTSTFYALSAETGAVIWSHSLSDYGLPSNTHSRTSPAVVNGTVFVGTQEGAWLLAIDAASGDLLWKTQLESPANDPFALITASPAVSGGLVYTGVASLQEGVAANPAFPCCNARGSVVAVDAKTGGIVWKTHTVPAGYSGGGVWGSNFVVDRKRGSLFVSTGNNYSQSTDPAYLTCISNGGTPATCASPNNHVDSILALDMNTGAIKWATKAVTWDQPFVANGSDDWNVACLVGFGPGQGNCPSDAGPDYDFASAPNLITYQSKGGPKTILGAGQKSGIYYALDPDTGAVLWHTQVGPGSALGGMEWGSASDGKRIYVSIANLYGIPTPVGGAGSWTALDPATGAILWQVGDPNGAITLGPLAVAKGVVFASSMAGSATAPTMLALDAATGQTLWAFAAGSSVNAGATIVDGDVYWGSGYAHLGIPGYTTNNKFFAFSKNGN
jgi:polyvinyl alcohol dehydrogenase (cytochrome)